MGLAQVILAMEKHLRNLRRIDMARKAVIVSSGVHPLVCPACGQNTITGEAGFGQAYSRYVGTYICSECGHREAFEGFFWRDRAEGDKDLRAKIKPHHKGKP